MKSLVRVDHFFVSNYSQENNFSLQNNYVFQHACKTPLTILKCSLSQLQEEMNQEIKHETIESAKSAVDRLESLIRSITATKRETEEFVVSSAIQEVIILSQQKNNCTITYHSSEIGVLRISGRQIYFQEMLVCMINNAIEAYQQNSKPHIMVVAQKKENTLHIHVIDFATGMSLVAQKMACMQGVSYKESGMGLGLYFVKKTIEEEFFGKFHLHSKLGMGTHIHVTIPVV